MTDSESRPNANPNALFSPDSDIKAVKLTDWLDWVTSKEPDPYVFVALPMLQRGSVWRPDQVIELWDSLLRGMPVGSLLVSNLKPGGMIRRSGDEVAKKTPDVMPRNSLSLLDGQQRTLAMCIGWPTGSREERCIWVDFGQKGTAGQPFKLRITTKYHPFGFAPNDPRGKLSRSEKRAARKHFDESKGGSWKDISDWELPLEKTEPSRATAPLLLHKLVEVWQSQQNVGCWSNVVKGMLNSELQNDAEVNNRIKGFGDALLRISKMCIALVRVSDEVVNDEGVDNVKELPLAALFRRIANNGTPLSAEDHVFALIKHRVPETHNLVYKLHAERHIGSLLTANELVMTAVRLAATEARQVNGEPFADVSKPNAKDFHRLLKAKANDEGDFLRGALLPLIERDAHDKRSLGAAFSQLSRLLLYRDDVDPGLPLLAMPLLRRPLVQPLVLWMHQNQVQGCSDTVLEESRNEVLRFVLFWLLCVGPAEKDQDKASRIAFQHLNHVGIQFPGKVMYEDLCAKDLALPLRSPIEVTEIAFSHRDPRCPQCPRLIRDWSSRFGQPVGDRTNPLRWFYGQFWYRRQLLLWLQRKSLVVIFPKANPLAGREEETPYDYDHICPQSHWHDCRASDTRALGQFCEGSGNRVLGESIGNQRIVDSSQNRSDGATFREDKLRLEDRDERVNNAIDEAEVKHWCGCTGDALVWDQSRAEHFRDAIELRTFNLYRRFFYEGGFETWIPNDPKETAS